MNKLVTPGFKGIVLTFFIILAILISGQLKAQGCVMSCPPMDPPTQISLSSDCEDVLTYGQIGVVLVGCPGAITVDIIVNGVSIGNTINSSMIGNTYMVIVTHPLSGQACMTTIMVVDKQDPIVDCPADVTLACNTDLDTYEGLTLQDVSDCSTVTISKVDVLQSSGNCNGNIISQYLRTYTVTDIYNNATTCEQLISLEKASLANVDFPQHLIGLTALTCFPAPDISPDHTGWPSVDDNQIVNGTFCNLSAGFSDMEAPVCSGSYKIFRTWTVVDWCAGNQTTSSIQIIEVLDKTPPIVITPANITVSTGPSSCSAIVNLAPATIMEDCSDSWTVRMEGPFGTIHANGGMLPSLPIGVHKITFKATNDCDLEGVGIMYITVKDLQPPVNVCRQSVGIPVNADGTTLIPAHAFNSASYDNCGNVYFKVKRMSSPAGYSCANPGNPNNAFDDQIQFCCEDIAHNNIMVVFRVYDVPPVPGPVSDTYLQGHFNDCMVQVEIQDKLPPQIICPSNLTISCEFPYTIDDLEVFGSVAFSQEDREPICINDPGAPGPPGIHCIGLDGLATDNCHVEIAESEPVINVNMCGVGTITRTFTAFDDGGLQSTCQQVITIINYNLFTPSDITWPSDYTTFDICEVARLHPDSLEAPYDEPLLHQGMCDRATSTYDDDVFDFSGGQQACFKILRTWQVIDWCQLEAHTGGPWKHVQVIKVMNSTGPEFSPIADINECSLDPQCGGKTIDFEAAATDDCSLPEAIKWKYFIDLDNNNSFDYTSPIITGGSIQFSRYMPIGTHRVLYTAWDRCGNTSAQEQFVTVESCTPPSAKCRHGLSTNLMAMDTDGDGTTDWGMVTLQASMFDGGSSHSCNNPISFAFSPDPSNVSRIFNCSDFGDNEIELWVIAANGTTDVCTTTVDIQDNNLICPGGLEGSGIISGNISVPGAGKLSNAMVYLEGSAQPGIPTANDGYFVFPAMPFGGDYHVRPSREGDARNGVTTLDLVKIQKHLLGLETFTTPYQYIAADANNSSSITAIDIIQLRKLILGFYNELPSNQSWRFIDQAHVFPDPQNPWVSPWPETYNIIPFSNSMNDVDFSAVKIGDVNVSANLQAGNGMIMPRSDKKCQLEYMVSPQTEEGVYQVNLYLNDALSYQALQFSMNWDQRSFALKDWTPGPLFSKEDIRMPEQSGENASISAFAVDGWDGEKVPVMTIWVEDVAKSGIPFQLFLNAKPTEPVAYQIHDDEAIAVQISGNKSTESKVQNRPNPFRDMTTIYLNSSREEKATLRIFDLNGRLVLTRAVSLEKGENEFIVSKTELRETGIYVYEIESDYQYSTNRMIIVD